MIRFLLLAGVEWTDAHQGYVLVAGFITVFLVTACVP